MTGRGLMPADMDAKLGEGLARLVPVQLREGLLLYLRHGYRPGDCLTAILSNDLLDAARRADPLVRYALADVATFLDEYAPAMAYGSREAVVGWLERGRALRAQEVQS